LSQDASFGESAATARKTKAQAIAGSPSMMNIQRQLVAAIR